MTLPTFTHAVQKVGSDPHQTDPQGPTDLDGFIRAIDAFPWIEQHIAWDESQDGPLPAVVLQNTSDKSELWVTALASPTASDADGRPAQWVMSEYQLFYRSMRLRKSMFGFGKETLKESTESAEVDTRAEAIALCRMFYEGDAEGLDRAIRRASDRIRD